MSRLLIHLGQSLLGGLGLVWLFLEAFTPLGPAQQPKVGVVVFLLAGLLLGGIWFAVDGWCITGLPGWRRGARRMPRGEQERRSGKRALLSEDQ